MSKPEPLLVDACVAINVRATGRWFELFEKAGWRPLLPDLALDEVLYVLDSDGERQTVPLREMASDDLLEVVALDPIETELMIKLAAQLGVGEAACLAVGCLRQIPVASDDRLARRVGSGMSPPVQLVSTSQLIRGWSSDTEIAAEDVQGVISLIQTRARFRPSGEDAEISWWHDQVTSGDEDGLSGGNEGDGQ